MENPESKKVEPMALIRVLRHLSEELDLLAESRDIDTAEAAVAVRQDVDRKLLEARRAGEPVAA